jgi:hypothetical protein
MSLYKLLESMDRSNKDTDDKAMNVIRTGLGVDEDFWDNFLLVINNSEGLSALLDVPTTKIGSWHNKVRQALSKVAQADERPNPKGNTKLIHTGLPSDENF